MRVERARIGEHRIQTHRRALSNAVGDDVRRDHRRHVRDGERRRRAPRCAQQVRRSQGQGERPVLEARHGRVGAGGVSEADPCTTIGRPEDRGRVEVVVGIDDRTRQQTYFTLVQRVRPAGQHGRWHVDLLDRHEHRVAGGRGEVVGDAHLDGVGALGGVGVADIERRCVHRADGYRSGAFAPVDGGRMRVDDPGIAEVDRHRRQFPRLSAEIRACINGRADVRDGEVRRRRVGCAVVVGHPQRDGHCCVVDAIERRRRTRRVRDGATRCDLPQVADDRAVDVGRRRRIETDRRAFRQGRGARADHGHRLVVHLDDVDGNRAGDRLSVGRHGVAEAVRACVVRIRRVRAGRIGAVDAAVQRQVGERECHRCAVGVIAQEGEVEGCVLVRRHDHVRGGGKIGNRRDRDRDGSRRHPSVAVGDRDDEGVLAREVDVGVRVGNVTDRDLADTVGAEDRSVECGGSVRGGSDLGGEQVAVVVDGIDNDRSRGVLVDRDGGVGHHGRPIGALRASLRAGNYGPQVVDQGCRVEAAVVRVENREVHRVRTGADRRLHEQPLSGSAVLHPVGGCGDDASGVEEGAVDAERVAGGVEGEVVGGGDDRAGHRPGVRVELGEEGVVVIRSHVHGVLVAAEHDIEAQTGPPSGDV